MKKTLFMETTNISASQTVSQIQAMLGENGAKAVMTEYENQEVSAVSFQIEINGKNVPFRLPCRAKAIEEIFIGKIKTRSTEVYSRMKADAVGKSKRVAWRQILRWIEAQVALVSTEMVTLDEVFLPYMQTGKNQTLYQLVSNQNFNVRQLEHQA